MNNLSQHEFDDELLSAYLDDELSTEERALVDDRLAADPAARHTLEQLRNVSHSVRELPTENVGRDLRDSILQRATATRMVRPESAKGVAPPSHQPPATSPQFPAVTIGRTTRGWVWASAAIAAALLIMLLQPGDVQNADLPAVARNDKPRSEAAAPLNRQLVESQPADHAAGNWAPPAMPEPNTDSTPAATSVEPSTTGLAVQAPKKAADTATTEPPKSDRFAFTAPGEVSEARAVAAPAVTPPADEAGVAGYQPVVVRLLAKPAAVEKNAFEALLRKHQVDVEPTNHRFDAEVAASEAAPAASARTRTPTADAPTAEASGVEAKAESPVATVTEHANEGNDNVEFVLVDAPSRTIFSCMNELSSDADNYLGISVDDAPLAGNLQEAESLPQNKQVAELRKFNRGVVPPLQETLADGESHYFYSPDDAAFRHAPSRYYVKARDFASGPQNESLMLDTERDADRGRALHWRLRVAGDAEHQKSSSGAAPFGALPAPGAKDKQNSTVDQLAVPAASDRDRMQVLFVIRQSDEPPPSLKARNQAQ